MQVQVREALGGSKGGFSTKIHLRCDGNGLPMTFSLTVGERPEAVMFVLGGDALAYALNE